MQAYRFRELSPDAQENALRIYNWDPVIANYIYIEQKKLIQAGSSDIFRIYDAFDSLGWLFNHLGERIA